MTLPPCFEDIIELALPDGDLLASEDTDLYTSKLGGRPIWLNAPSQELLDSLKCPKCGVHLFLLLQMDCPREEFPNHDRILYLFVCNTRVCSQDPSGWRAIFMSKKVKNGKEKVSSTKTNNFWDSLMGEDKESSLLTTSTASAISESSSTSASGVISNLKNKFPGIYLHIDEEIIVEKRDKKASDTVIPESPVISGNDEDWKGEEYEKFRVPGTDKSFSRFQKRIAHYPRQCVRYAVSGGQSPLLYHDMNLKEAIEKLPACSNQACKQNCSSHRFELQLMPAILAFLPTEAANYISHIPEAARSKNPLISDGMEWATVLVYSCAAFCGFIDSQEASDASTIEGSVIIQLEPSSSLIHHQ